MTVMLFRKHVGGRVFYGEGFLTRAEAERVKAVFEAKDAKFGTRQPVETYIEETGAPATVETQLDLFLTATA